MNFNQVNYENNNNDFNTFETFRSTTNLLNNYALICSIPLINKFISVICKIECISGEKYEVGYFRFGTKWDNMAFINEAISPNDFKIVGDKTSQYLNIYVKSNMAGATVKVTVEDGTGIGFIDFKQLSTFTFLESNFTSKVTPTSNVKFINSSMKVNGDINLSGNAILDGGTSAKSLSVKRENSGVVNRLFSYVSNLGYAIFGRCKNDSDSLSDFSSGMMFTENDVRVYCQNGGAFCPDKANQYDLGKNDLRFNRLFLNKGIILADTKPSTPINGETYFDTSSKKVVTYWYGKWYCDGIEVTV